MALVHDYLPVGRDLIHHGAAANPAPQHGRLQATGELPLARGEGPDRPLVETEEHRELDHPLAQERPPVHQDERARLALGDQVRPENRLADGSPKVEAIVGAGGAALQWTKILRPKSSVGLERAAPSFL
jgi:hypothetical protein